MKFLFYEILHLGPPLEVVWGPHLEGQSATHGAKCHAQRKVPHCRICILWKENVKV